MNHKRITTTAAAALFCLQPFVATSAEDATSVSEMFTDGSASTSFRYRYEMVDQDGIDKDAGASTLKSRITWKSAAYKGFTAGIEVDNVTVIGNESYKTPTNGMAAYPIVADPKGTDLNQAFVGYSASSYSGKLGRQRILHAGQRFVGGVGWRQNEQTYDALSVSMPSLGAVKVDYSYIWNVNRIFGPVDSAVQAKQWGSDSHALLASYSPAAGHSLTGYAYLLDFDNACSQLHQHLRYRLQRQVW